MTTVVHIITALGAGGAERVVYLVASRGNGKNDERHIVVSLMGAGIYGDELRRAGVEVRCLDMRRGPIASLLGFIKLVRLLWKLKPDVVMTWLYHADLFGTIAGLLTGVRRIVWNLRCSNLVFSEHPATTGWIVSLLARLSRIPDAIAANSMAGQRAHEELGFHPKRWVYLPNGFDTAEWSPDATDRAGIRSALGFSATDFVVGRIGRIDPQKDWMTFIAAARMAATRQPAMRVLLVGEGTAELELPPELRCVTQALGVRRDMPRLMRSLDILVSSSAYGEGLPNVVAEAMASGVPCVVTDVGDSAILVGDDGVVVPPRDPEALARGIEALMAKSAADLTAMGARARDRVSADYSITSFLRRYAELFGGKDGM